MITTTRRSLITGLISLIAAPAIIRAGSLMPVNPNLISDDKLILPGFWAEVDGTVIRFRDSIQNTGSMTLNINSWGPKELCYIDGKPVKAGELILGKTYMFKLKSDS